MKKHIAHISSRVRSNWTVEKENSAALQNALIAMLADKKMLLDMGLRARSRTEQDFKMDTFIATLVSNIRQ